MAKRRRLTPITEPLSPDAPLETKSRNPAPPIAQVAGASAAFSANEALEEKMRREGRLVVTLSLEAIVETHLMRDRMGTDMPEMEALKASLSAHGQRTAIEVEELGAGRFGLISGWRRLTALKSLYAETGEDRFGRVLALLRQPEDRAEAYISMVEENEIRAGLSYYERARVAAKAAGQGAFESPEAAVNALFASGSRARRSKIRSFLRVYASLDDVLQFPQTLPERLGLKLAEALKAGKSGALRDALAANPAQTAEAETNLLNKLLSGTTVAGSKSAKPEVIIHEQDGLKVTSNKASTGFGLVFSGPRATLEMEQSIGDFLRAHLQSR